MGPAYLAAIPSSDEFSLRRPSSGPLQALPSPTNASQPLLSSRSLSTPSTDAASPLWTPRPLMPDTTNARTRQIDNTPFQAPSPSRLPPMTDMNIIVGGALAPVRSTPPPMSSPESTMVPPRLKAGPGLRLPSFESLGIAAPHPDRFGELTLNGVLADEPLSATTESLDVSTGAEQELLPACGQRNSSDARGELESGGHGGRAVQSLVHQYISTLTPPAESGQQQWPSLMTVSNGAIDPPNTDHDAPPMDAPSACTSPGPSAGSGTALESAGGAPNAPCWIDGAVRSVLENLQNATMADNPLRVLSHALPSPSSTGHIYPNIISSMHDLTPTSPTVWINVFHAIPGRFNLADLPTSPPATPGPPVGGDDYFTQKIFDSAVPISDYQSDLSSLPRSPRPVVPPSSINVSIVERYIPPTSVNEFADMFNTNGPSILVDRLVELSPHNGSLVFIYPTRTGGHTFMKGYLGPLLDPIIRSMAVVNGLSSDLGRNLGSMVSVDRLPEHDDMHRQMVHLCAALSGRNNSMQNFHGCRGQFELSYVAKREVKLPREVWARDWWTKQEKPRVKDVVTQTALEAQRKNTSNDHLERPATPAELIQQLLDSICRKAYREGQEPERGVEVSVFVIKRSG